MSIFVTDQRKALAFYTEVLGFVPVADVPLGEYSWLTVASPEDPGGMQILLEPNQHPAVVPFTSAIVADGIPWTSFAVDDVQAEYDRLMARGVVTYLGRNPSRQGDRGNMVHPWLKRKRALPFGSRILPIVPTRSRTTR
jgi:catechol 2,3-dioxygenase-like lactoylglutathione lyase family enzyme